MVPCHSCHIYGTWGSRGGEGGGDFKAITCEKSCNEGPTFNERSWLLYKPLFSD